jgi:hypothetical protein
MDHATAGRLARERLPRFGLAFLLAVLPIILLVRKRGKRVAWLAGAALLCLALFNSRYAILARRSYSLSSVASPNDIILFTAGTAAIALSLAWLAISIPLRTFKVEPRQAAETTLGITFLTLYLLALPSLWSYALNGALVIWILPEMGSMFLAFLSILQSMVVAVVGLLLSGVAALIAFYRALER